MLLKCCLLHRSLTVTCYILYICLHLVYISVHLSIYVYILVYLCLIYVTCFFIIIFISITINHLISLTQKKLFFGHVCQRFNLRVLLSFCLSFWQFEPGVAYKSVAYKKACSLLHLSTSLWGIPWKTLT